MIRTKAAGVAVALAALGAGPLAATPAHAQLQPTCPSFEYPYSYPCDTAEDVINFAVVEAGDAAQFVFAMRDKAGEAAFIVLCTVFPNQPECA